MTIGYRLARIERAGGEAASRGSRRRRVAALIAIVFAALVIAAWSFVANYQPLGLGTAFAGVRGCAPQDTRYGPPFDGFVIRCGAPGQTARWGYTIANRGSFGVRLTYVKPVEIGLINAKVRDGGPLMCRDDDSDCRAPMTDAAPLFTGVGLAPGAERFLYFQGTSHQCDDTPGGWFTERQVTITFKFFGFTRHDHVPIAHE